MYAAKIDYVTFVTPSRFDLPELQGTAKWPPNHFGQRLTIHDPTAADLRRLLLQIGPLKLYELEVAVDMRLPKRVDESVRQEVLARVMVDQIGKRLVPDRGLGMTQKARVLYRRHDDGYSLAGFNRRKANPTDQQLHGWRHDGVQVKAYWKRADQRRRLQPHRAVARMEVRLGAWGLREHGLLTIADLEGFRFRKMLMPYFTHVRAVDRRYKDKLSPNPLTVLMRAKLAQIDAELFGELGVGPFIQGGLSWYKKPGFQRDTEVNGRIGQALLRLEAAFRQP